jgi:hypothetical protein
MGEKFTRNSPLNPFNFKSSHYVVNPIDSVNPADFLTIAHSQPLCWRHLVQKFKPAIMQQFPEISNNFAHELLATNCPDKRQ